MLVPDQIFADRYRVIRHIADGGMGAVFEAEHIATEARVALKLLLPHVVQMTSARRRFELEAKVAARVNSEHIVKVFDAGVDAPSRSPYLAMELLRGLTLAAQIKQRGPLPAHAVIELMRQVASGLDAAHGYHASDGKPQPIVHRDLKPENLFLGIRPDGSRQVKILDFGIAKVLSESTEVSQDMRGTPLYMAFEQAAGEAVSPQTDIWALGLITFFALTGRRYWPAGNKATGSTQALFAEILTLPLPAPSQRVRDEGLDVSLPLAFDTWLLTCIDRNPSRRYASAGLAVDMLERALSRAAHASLGSPVDSHYRLRARVTERYELPLSTTTNTSPSVSLVSIASGPSMAGVASEYRPATTRPRRRATWLLAGGLCLASLLGSLAAWRITRFREAANAPQAAAPAPEAVPSAAPRTVEVIRLDRNGERLSPVEEPAGPRVRVETLRPILIAEPAPPAVRPAVLVAEPQVRATAPVVPRATPPEVTPPRAAPKTAPAAGVPALGAAAGGSVQTSAPAVPGAVAPPAASTPQPEPAPQPEPTAEPGESSAPGCDFFDPYTGRCTNVPNGSSASPSTP